MHAVAHMDATSLQIAVTVPKCKSLTYKGISLLACGNYWHVVPFFVTMCQFSPVISRALAPVCEAYGRNKLYFSDSRNCYVLSNSPYSSIAVAV